MTSLYLPTENSKISSLFLATLGAAPGAYYLQAVKDYGLVNSVNVMINATGKSTAQDLAATIAQNLGLSGSLLTAGQNYFATVAFGGAKTTWAANLIAAMDTFASLTGDATWGAAASAHITRVNFAVAYSLNPSNNSTDLGALAAAVGTPGQALPGKTLTLTDEPEVVTLTGSQVDKVFGVMDGADSTLNNGDVIEGNGNTLLRIVVDTVDDVPNADVSGVSVLEFIGGVAGTVTFDNGWDIDTLRVLNSENSFYVSTENMSPDVNVEISNADYNWVWGTMTNDWYFSMGATGDLSQIDGNITGVADVDGNLYVSFSAQNNDAGSIKLGNVTLSAEGGNGDTAEFYVFQTQDKGGDITVGNITISGFDNATVTLENYDGIASDTAVRDITVGKLSLNVGKGDYAYVEFDNTADDQAELGNLTVGDVSVVLGKTADADLYFNNGWGGATSTAVYGDLTIGNINLDVGASATLDFTVSQGATTADVATVGDYTVGNIVLNVANSGDADIYFSRSVYVDSGADIGDMTFGDITINVGINATASFSISDSIEADSVDADDFTIGNFKMGNLVATVDDGGYLDFDLTFTFDGSSTELKDYMDFRLGNVSIQAGASATASYTFDISSEANFSVQRGDVALNALKDSYIWFSESFTAYTTGSEITSYTAGNISLTAAQAATASYELEFSAYSENDLGDITIGNVAVNASGKSAYADFSLDASDTNFNSIGKTTVGNVTVSAVGENADAYFFQYMFADDDVDGAQYGNINITGNGKNAYASFSATLSADEVGSVNIGNITMSAIGEGADAVMQYEMYSANDGGTLKVGNVTLSVTGAAKKTGTNLLLDLENTGTDGADIVIGNVSLSSTSVRASDDTAMTYDAEFEIDADGDVTIGNITVTGGNVDSEFDDWGTLSNWLDVSAGGTITVGAVDYSGYTGKSTVTNEINLSSFRGADTIKGSAVKDNIYDTEDTNQIWGGASADKFVFTTDNSGKTLTTMDQIMDFSYSGGDTIDVGISATSGEYNEGSFANFTAFVTAVNAGNKDIYVGNVTGAAGLILAVDHDSDDAVDFMVMLTGVTSLSNVDLSVFV